MNVNVCFHGIGTCVNEREPGESRYWISQDVFLHILDCVAGHSNVQLSFDDGNASDLEIGLPALQERGLTAMFFVLAGRLQDPASLGAEALRELGDAQMRIGNHGWRHVSWRGLSSADEHLELIEARRVLEEASGSPVTTAALPLGQYDRSLLRSLKQAGYRTVYSSDRFPVRSGSWLQARYSVTADTSVDSVRRLVRGRGGPAEGRNMLASGAKRLR